MEVGDIVKHKNMPDRLRIRTLSGDVCTLEFIDRPKIYYSGSDSKDYERCVSRVESIALWIDEMENQLNLFK